ncbi:membrane protease YdiL (CAAX protease family) [Streptosporangium album]|uniref:Membrane protease YdiL (CAAX protease family) n=1 Tax=Streptosporangium album TaxID=47479 RepID=A0A7W7RX06_9ACTN|nr:CPBP family intramembrane glutamic endopeptidase [Streptosporangium album]MBB4939715.1 membrane protease YdiL (CAAX protease family) [Streptosporangium album]
MGGADGEAGERTPVGGAVTAGRRVTLAGAVAVLVAANVLNNRLAPRLAPLTSAVATGALLALARRSGLSWSELGFHRRSRGLRIGGALASAVAAVYGAGIAIPATRRFFRDERALSLSTARAFEEALLQVPIGTVLLEEVGFRGVLHALLARSYGPRPAVVVSSALFGLWHVLPAMDMATANPALSGLASGEAPGGGASGDGPRGGGGGDGRPADPRLEVSRVVVGSVAATGLAGAVFCELRRRGGLAAPALLHVATNSLGYLFARLAPAEPFRQGERPVPAPEHPA